MGLSSVTRSILLVWASLHASLRTLDVRGEPCFDGPNNEKTTELVSVVSSKSWTFEMQSINEESSHYLSIASLFNFCSRDDAILC